MLFQFWLREVRASRPWPTSQTQAKSSKTPSKRVLSPVASEDEAGLEEQQEAVCANSIAYFTPLNPTSSSFSPHRITTLIHHVMHH